MATASNAYEWKTAFVNLSIWLNSIILGCIYCAITSMALFMPTIISNLAFQTSSHVNQLLTVPPYIAGCISCISLAILTDKFGRKGLILCCFSGIALIGFTILALVESSSVRYFGVFLVTIGAFPGAPLALCWGLINSGSSFGRIISAALLVGNSTVFGICATWIYPLEWGPRYWQGHTINIFFMMLGSLAAILLVFYFRWENRQRERGHRDYRLLEKDAACLGRRSPMFRYSE